MVAELFNRRFFIRCNCSRSGGWQQDSFLQCQSWIYYLRVVGYEHDARVQWSDRDGNTDRIDYHHEYIIAPATYKQRGRGCFRRPANAHCHEWGGSDSPARLEWVLL